MKFNLHKPKIRQKSENEEQNGQWGHGTGKQLKLNTNSSHKNTSSATKI